MTDTVHEPPQLPIAEAKALAGKYNQLQVIIVTWNGSVQTVVTFGTDDVNSDQAAQGGDFVKAALGWPESLKVMPNRFDKLRDTIIELDAQLANTQLEAAGYYNRIGELETRVRELTSQWELRQAGNGNG